MQRFKLKHTLTLLLLVCCFISTTGSKPLQDGSILIRIQLVFAEQPLVLNTQKYLTPNGDTVSFDQFRFYLGHPELINNEQKVAVKKNEYYLIDADKPSTLLIKLDHIAPGNYSSIRFLLGVDSLSNVSGAMAGALDPAKGMYWTWNTGYINAKLQGTSGSCNTLHNAFDFHVGGFTAPYNTLRTIILPLDNLLVTGNKTTIIDMNADVAAWFDLPTKIDLSTTNHVVLPGKEAMMMADNYADMLSVKQVVK